MTLDPPCDVSTFWKKNGGHSCGSGKFHPAHPSHISPSRSLPPVITWCEGAKGKQGQPVTIFHTSTPHSPSPCLCLCPCVTYHMRRAPLPSFLPLVCPHHHDGVFFSFSNVAQNKRFMAHATEWGFCPSPLLVRLIGGAKENQDNTETENTPNVAVHLCRRRGMVCVVVATGKIPRLLLRPVEHTHTFVPCCELTKAVCGVFSPRPFFSRNSCQNHENHFCYSFTFIW